MPRFTVHLIETVSTAVDVEADNVEGAVDAAYDSPDMPGSMGHGAFGQASVDEDGEWTAVAVSDDNGDEVWREPSDYEQLVEARKEIERLRAQLARVEHCETCEHHDNGLCRGAGL